MDFGMKKFLILLFFLFPATGFAASDNVAGMMLDVHEAETLVAAHPKEAALINGWLKHTYEVRIHQMRGANGNQVFVHKDGHEEYVFDANRQPVQDGMNDGSYNYYPQQTEPLLHFMYDTLPWITWGSSKQDPTTKPERLKYYLEDLQAGMVRAREASIEPLDMNTLSTAKRYALAIFMRAIEDGKAGAIYDYLSSAPENPQASPGNFYEGLNKATDNMEMILSTLPKPPQRAETP